jgi:hypothetical protein
MNLPYLESGSTLNIKVRDITEKEVIVAVRQLTNKMAGKIDNIPPEAIKSMDKVSASYLHRLLNRIWNEECIPEDWYKELLVKLQKGGTFLCGTT